MQIIHCQVKQTKFYFVHLSKCTSYNFKRAHVEWWNIYPQLLSSQRLTCQHLAKVKAFLGRDENTSVFVSYVLIFFQFPAFKYNSTKCQNYSSRCLWGEGLMNMEMKIIIVSPASHPPGQRLFLSWLLGQMLQTGSLWAEKSHCDFSSSLKHF